MKRSDINYLIRRALAAFRETGWALPPNPRWDVTDFGLGDWRTAGLVLVNLAEEPEYCEKLMYAQRGMVTPSHCHEMKKEDIICRSGFLAITLWNDAEAADSGAVPLKLNGVNQTIPSGTRLTLGPGERVTLFPTIYHEFVPLSEECVIGEVSTANDDSHDNYFSNPAVGRYPEIEEDEPGTIRLVGELS